VTEVLDVSFYLNMPRVYTLGQVLTLTRLMGQLFTITAAWAPLTTNLFECKVNGMRWELGIHHLEHRVVTLPR
jgi:hypothetical protein